MGRRVSSAFFLRVDEKAYGVLWWVSFGNGKDGWEVLEVECYCRNYLLTLSRSCYYYSSRSEAAIRVGSSLCNGPGGGLPGSGFNTHVPLA